jgi:hypothetical protein
MLPVSLDCSLLIAPSVFPNVYFNQQYFWEQIIQSSIAIEEGERVW